LCFFVPFVDQKSETTMLPEFDLLRPQTLSEALALLAEHAPDVMPLAGGTNVIVELRDGHPCPRCLMDVSKLRELRGIHHDEGRVALRANDRVVPNVVIGGGTTIAELLTHPLIAEHGLPLKQAAARLGNPLVRNRATVAGNLVNASPAADTAPPLIALGAEIELTSKHGTRRVPLDEFMIGVNKTLIQPDELVTAIRWPAPPARSAAGFYKIGLRKADACSVINAAVMVAWDENGRCRQARIAIGAAAPRPVRAQEAEAALVGQPLKADVIAEVARLAAQATRPVDDIRGTAAYRQRMAEVMVRRLLNQMNRET
jgi:CO/xanthine dehydrogenase FAD-binding subunit